MLSAAGVVLFSTLGNSKESFHEDVQLYLPSLSSQTEEEEEESDIM